MGHDRRFSTDELRLAFALRAFFQRVIAL